MFTIRSALLFWQPVNRPEMMENLPEMETNGKEGDQEMQSQKCSFQNPILKFQKHALRIFVVSLGTKMFGQNEFVRLAMLFHQEHWICEKGSSP